MTSQQPQAEYNKAIVRRLIEEWWYQQNQAVVDEIIDPTFIDHDCPGQIPGPEGVRQGGAEIAAENPFPDLQFTIEDMIAEGDKVAVRGTWHDTHQGDWKTPIGTFPATGKQASITGLVMFRLAGGKLVEAWGGGDSLDVLQQLGVVDGPGQAGG